MAGMIKYLQSFRFKGLTVILGVFLAISVVLWTERSGIQYQAEIKKKADNKFFEGETKSGRGRAGKAFLFCALVIGCVGICMICR